MLSMQQMEEAKEKCQMDAADLTSGFVGKRRRQRRAQKKENKEMQKAGHSNNV